MTKRLQPAVLDLKVAANVEAERGRVLKLVSSRPPAGSRAKTPKPRSWPRSWKFVPVEDVLFAEMAGNASVKVFTDDEIERMGERLGLSEDEVAALYKP
jgi:hypothetical protein